MARLKVFKAHMGFFDSVVAAPSQKAALEAWGTRQDLFHEGLAEVTDDPEAAKAALARPGVVLRRAAGSADPYREEAAPPAAPRLKRPGRAAKTAAAHSAPPRPPPDRSELTAAEAALAAAERKHATEAAALERERRAAEQRMRELEARAAKAEDAYASKRRALETAVDQARRAYRRAGGT